MDTDTTAAEEAAANTALTKLGRAILEGQIRHLLTLGGGLLIYHGWATQDQINPLVPELTSSLAGLAIIMIPHIWSYLDKIAVDKVIKKAKTSAAAGSTSSPKP